MLITNGYIDEAYRSYTSYSYPGSLTIGDNRFVKSVLENSPLEYSYSLDNPSSIEKKLSEKYFANEAICNNNLMSFLLRNKNAYKSKLTRILDGDLDNRAGSFIASYIRFLCVNNYETELRDCCSFINSQYPEFLSEFVKQDDDYVKQFVQVSLCFLDDAVWKNVAVDKVKNYIEANKYFLETQPWLEDILPAKMKENEYKLISLQVDLASKKCLEYVIKENLYYSNPSNVYNVIKYSCKDDNNRYKETNILTALFENPHLPVSAYILKDKTNLEGFMTGYTMEAGNERLDESESCVVSMINLLDQYILAVNDFIKKLNTKISNIMGIPSKHYDLMYTQGLILATEKNVLMLYASGKEEMTTTLLKEMKAPFKWKNIKRIPEHEESFFNFICLSDINIDLKKSYIYGSKSKASAELLEDIDLDLLDFLIDRKKIEVNSRTIEIIKQRREDLLDCFIAKNIDEVLSLEKTNFLSETEITSVLKHKELKPNKAIALLRKNPAIMISEVVLPGIFSPTVLEEIVRTHISDDDIVNLKSREKEFSLKIQRIIETL